MFTGIVQGTAIVQSITRKDDFMQLTVELPEERCENLQLGASIALNGTCLTVTAFEGRNVSFDLIIETLKVTNLGKLDIGDRVNFERAARFGDEIGGHVLSGHVHTQVQVAEIERTETNCILWFEAENQWLPYLFPKGFVALNGCSLTIGEIQENRFNVYLIPETLSVTTFGTCQKGDNINMEIDAHTQAIVDTVEQYMANRPKSFN
ncbi:MAG: riboflavin synthase subunit alpha [Neptuniibacter sp.]